MKLPPKTAKTYTAVYIIYGDDLYARQCMRKMTQSLFVSFVQIGYIHGLRVVPKWRRVTERRLETPWYLVPLILTGGTNGNPRLTYLILLDSGAFSLHNTFKALWKYMRASMKTSHVHTVQHRIFRYHLFNRQDFPKMTDSIFVSYNKVRRIHGLWGVSYLL